MDIHQAQNAYGKGLITEIVIEPAETGNGWTILLHSSKDESEKLTDHSGQEKVFHDLDHATEAAKNIGSSSPRIEEPF